MAGILKFSGLLGFSSGEKSLTRAAQRDAAKAIDLCLVPACVEGGEAAETRLRLGRFSVSYQAFDLHAARRRLL